uniref:Uncharacterized protein n=1 Tax=Arundo donax TaxID=35708 RepID=A0A0A9AYT9_ARUDO
MANLFHGINYLGLIAVTNHNEVIYLTFLIIWSWMRLIGEQY